MSAVTVQRFDLDASCDCYGSAASMEESADGDWVRYADYAALEAALAAPGAGSVGGVIRGRWLGGELYIHADDLPRGLATERAAKEAAEAKYAEEAKWAAHYRSSYELAHNQAMSNGSAYRAERNRAEVAEAELARLRKGIADLLCENESGETVRRDLRDLLDGSEVGK